jgi:hypothetical protein
VHHYLAIGRLDFRGSRCERIGIQVPLCWPGGGRQAIAQQPEYRDAGQVEDRGDAQHEARYPAYRAVRQHAEPVPGYARRKTRGWPDSGLAACYFPAGFYSAETPYGRGDHPHRDEKPGDGKGSLVNIKIRYLCPERAMRVQFVFNSLQVL